MEFLAQALLGLLIGFFVFGIYGLILAALIIYFAIKKRSKVALILGVVLLFYLILWILIVWQRPILN